MISPVINFIDANGQDVSQFYFNPVLNSLQRFDIGNPVTLQDSHLNLCDRLLEKISHINFHYPQDTIT